MLANLLVPTKTAPVFDAAAFPQTGAEGKATLDFAALLPGAEAPETAENDVATARHEAIEAMAITAQHPTQPGVDAAMLVANVPLVAESGKILPPAAATPLVTEIRLPVEDGENAPAPALSVGLGSALPPVAQPPTPAVPNVPPADPAQSQRGGATASDMHHTGARQGVADAGAPNVTAKPAPNTAAPVAVTLQVASVAERTVSADPVPAARSVEAVAHTSAFGSSARGASAEDAETTDRGPAPDRARLPLRSAADLPRFQIATDTAATALVGSAAMGEIKAEGAIPVITARSSLEAPVLRELNRIVETLASAREAIGTGSATLALNHAEFGALSLRFDQRADGMLSVQLAAADADAQQAVASAVAERPIAAPGEAGAASNNAQSQGQSNSQQSGNSGLGRGALADRDGHSANPETQRDQPRERHRDSPRGPDAGDRGTRRSGIYA